MIKNKNSSQGLGLGVILFLIFMILKLTGYIDWSWWWVTCPLWGGLVIFIIIFVFLIIVFGR